MPYVEGRRVSNEEWRRLYGTTTKLHTGANGENPAAGPDIDEATGTVKVEPKKGKAGGNRSPKSAAATKAAIADALGVTDTSPQLADIDVSGLDADVNDPEDE